MNVVFITEKKKDLSDWCHPKASYIKHSNFRRNCLCLAKEFHTHTPFPQPLKNELKQIYLALELLLDLVYVLTPRLVCIAHVFFCLLLLYNVVCFLSVFHPRVMIFYICKKNSSM